MIASLAGKTFGLKAMGIAVGACVVMFLALGVMTNLYLGKVEEVGTVSTKLAAEAKARAEDFEQAKITNDTNLAVIDAQQASLAICAADAQARTAAVETALERERQRASGLARMLDAERRERQRIYAADPEAKAWAEQLIPLAIEQQLRARG